LGSEYAAPKHASTLGLSQTLPNGIELTVLHQNSSKFTPQATQTGDMFARKRTDVRVSAPLQVGRHRGELAMVVQNLGGPYQDLRPQFTFQRKAFVTLTFQN
jgi:hypothetical protein